MSQSITIVASVLIFMVGLIFTKAILYALGMVLAFILFSIAFETVWQARKSPVFIRFIRPAVNYIVTAAISLCTYIILFLPVEFLITDIYLIIPKIPTVIGTSILILFAIGFSFVDWQKKLSNKRRYVVFILFIMTCGCFYFVYRNEKLAREYLPKIYHLSRNGGYQGEQFTISGTNFGLTFQPGKVYIDNDEVVVIGWNENKINFELPVPDRFGIFDLKLLRYDGLTSNPILFEIKDPGNLHINTKNQ